MEQAILNRIDLLNIHIQTTIAAYVERANLLCIEDIESDDFVASETIGEVLDKLIILNIRIWHLEDQVDGASNEEMLAIQRKLRHCFRVKRPRLVAALNKMLAELVAKGRFDLVVDEYIKSYTGER